MCLRKLRDDSTKAQLGWRNNIQFRPLIKLQPAFGNHSFHGGMVPQLLDIRFKQHEHPRNINDKHVLNDLTVGSLLPVLRAFAEPTHSILNCSSLPTTSHIDAAFSRSRNIDPAAQAIRQLSVCRDKGGELSAQCSDLIGAGIIGPCLKVVRRRNACSRTG